MRSYAEILERIERGEALVMTSQEVCELVASGEHSELQEVDVVTAATRAVMSGTYALFSFSAASPGTFSRAKRVWINGIEAHVGPCPNENLGILDVMIYGTAHSRDDPDYGGGHLFRELAEGKTAGVKIETDRGIPLQSQIALDEMPFARLCGSRHAFKNYSAFVNPGKEPVSTIFHARRFEPRCQGATFSGCGQINPLKNDPLLESIGLGTRIQLNGAQGYVTGTGTRSQRSKPNLTGFADMHLMNPELMGGFVTSAGPECICTWAVPIPVTSETILQEIARLDGQIGLPVMDVSTRRELGQANYGEVWNGVDLAVEFDSQRCRECARCLVEKSCPMRAVSFDGLKARRDDTLCFHCGLCVSQCPSRAFSCNLGSIRLSRPGGDTRVIPVVLRQSDRLRALKAAKDLRDGIREGSFRISEPVQRIS